MTRMRRCIGSAYDRTPGAVVLGVEAGIAILKAPAVGEEVGRIAFSIVRYGGIV